MHDARSRSAGRRAALHLLGYYRIYRIALNRRGCDLCGDPLHLKILVNPMIAPTVGRIVWYRPSPDDRIRMNVISADQALKADVVYVHGNGLVNLRVIDHLAQPHRRESVLLRQDGEVEPEGAYCEWMPYQKAVAKGEIAPTLHAKEKS
jgi:hypothetical protein